MKRDIDTAVSMPEGLSSGESGVRRPALEYARRARESIQQIEETQIAAIEQAVERCAGVISRGGLVHLFGSGHSRIAAEEMFPRYGSFPGFHPIVELSLSNYHQIVGANGLSQAMFIENVEELGRVIVGNFRFDANQDLMIVISSSGANAVPIEVSLAARERGLYVIAITSLQHSTRASSRHSSGQRLFEVADLVIDTCTPPGDAAVTIDGLETPVGPLSTIASVTVINMIKTGVAHLLTENEQPPPVMTSSVLVGEDRSRALFQECFEIFSEQRRRL